MITHLSPKDLALVIGVSESSLKRWVDEGRLAAARTAGGHRRIALHEAVRFIRDSGATLARPDLLGLPDLSTSPLNAVAGGNSEAALLRALQEGFAEQARGLILAQYLTARSVAAVCDGSVAHAMHRLGELWRHSEEGIMVEHRATEIVLDALHQIRLTLPPAPEGAPSAVGGAAPDDPYRMPSLMAATVLMENGYRDVNLGGNTPIDSLLDAVRQHRPRIVWLSLSIAVERSVLLESLDKLAEGVAAINASLVLGGRGVFGHQLPNLPNAHVVASMAELAAFARGARTQQEASRAETLSVAPPVNVSLDGKPQATRAVRR